MLIFIKLLTLISSARQLTSEFKFLSNPKELKKYKNLGSSHKLSIMTHPLDKILVTRVSGSKENRMVQENIIKHFEELGWFIQQDIFNQTTPLGDTMFKNIIVTHDQKATRKLVLGAHYDSKYFKEFEFIGATDSAASVAILMNIATVLTPVLDKMVYEGGDR
jgi:glutaminyl-peptide cyclotransferase